MKRYTFWDVDDASSTTTAAVVSSLLSSGPHENVSVRTGHDNLVRGGVVRTDIRCSDKSIEAPYPITSADVTALRVLAVATRQALRDGHRLTLRGCSPAVRRLLHLSHLRRMVVVDPGDGHQVTVRGVG